MNRRDTNGRRRYRDAAATSIAALGFALVCGFACAATILSDGQLKIPNPEIALPGAETPNEDRFGFHVAFDGDTAVVSAHGDQASGALPQGTVYVYVRVGNDWELQANLTGSDTQPLDEFGWPVAISGNTIVVGARFSNFGGDDDRGAAYVFVRNGNTWDQQAKLVANDRAIADLFGTCVGVDGDLVVVGALQADIGGNVDQGAAYVFTRSGSLWTQQAKLVAPDGAPTDWFGVSCAIDGNTALIGARQDDIAANSNQGSAYVYVYNSSWAFQQKLSAADGLAEDWFGNAVAIDGNTALIGARLADTPGVVRQSRCSVCVRAQWRCMDTAVTSSGGRCVCRRSIRSCGRLARG